MGYVFDFKEANDYDRYLQAVFHPVGIGLEKKLALSLLRPSRGETVLDIGCGTGLYFNPLLEASLQVTGVDPSQYMLDKANQKICHRVDLQKSFAEDLPFDDNSFAYSTMITTLEFVDNPKRALEEAFRVTKDRMLIGILNPHTIRGLKCRVKTMIGKNGVLSHARFYSIGEVIRMSENIIGDVPIYWRTLSRPPRFIFGETLEEKWQSVVQRFAFGCVAFILVVLKPKYTTDGLNLRYCSQPTMHNAVRPFMGGCQNTFLK